MHNRVNEQESFQVPDDDNIFVSIIAKTSPYLCGDKSTPECPVLMSSIYVCDILSLNETTLGEIMSEMYLLTGQLFSEFGLLVLHAAEFFLLALEAKLHLQRLAAVTLHRGALGTARLGGASKPPGGHHVPKQRLLRTRWVAHKVKSKRWPKGIWERRDKDVIKRESGARRRQKHNRQLFEGECNRSEDCEVMRISLKPWPKRE